MSVASSAPRLFQSSALDVPLPEIASLLGETPADPGFGSAGDELSPAFTNAGERGGGTIVNGKTSYTVAEAAAQIDRLGTGNSWSGTLGTAATVTYSFRSSAPTTMPNGTSGFSQFNATQITQAELALQSWSDVARITFTRVGGTGYSNAGQINFGNYSAGASGAAAFAYFPRSTLGAWFNSTLSYNVTPAYLNYGRHTLLHEIGHTIGLSHPGDYDASEGSPTYANSAAYYEDTRQYSVMSYWGESNTGGSFGGNYASGPLLDDIAAAQRLYGANMTTRTGDTVYGFNSNTAREFYTATAASSRLIFAAWDAGGTDTFDFSGYSQTQTIDLREGYFSSVGGLTGNVAIAIGAVIENAIGGSGVDTITGNAARNVLRGQGGNDTLNGLGGDDILIGGAGADTLIGGDGSDTASYQDASAGVTADLSGGTGAGEAVGDTFSGIENLAGSAFDDILTGDGGANVLTGGLGNDRLDGGAGVDAARLFGTRSSYTLTPLGSGDLRVSGGDGVDVVRNIEQLAFDDRTLTIKSAFSPATSWSSVALADLRDIYLVGDYTGDGRDDVFRQTAAGGDVFASAGVSFALPAQWTGAGAGSNGLFYAGDVNGDGKDDIVRGMDGIGAQVLLSDGARFSFAGTWSPAGPGSDTRFYVGDFNGDGRDDIMRGLDGIGAQVFLSTGSSFSFAGTWTPAGNGSDNRFYVGDFNGDGRDDILRGLDGIGTQVFISTGSGFASAGNWTPAGRGTDGLFHIGDFNNDGRDDIARWMDGTGAQAFLSTGADFVQDGIWSTASYPIGGRFLAGDFTGAGGADFANLSGAGINVIA